MYTSIQKRRTWKRAPVQRIQSLIKENSEQKIEKITRQGESALLITYKDSTCLKDLIFLKKATNYLCKNDLPFSTLLSFDHTKEGYRGTWSFCRGKTSPTWEKDHYSALGSFLGKMHKACKNYQESSLQKLPIILTLQEQYSQIKDFLPESFSNILPLIKHIENNWPVYLPTGLVHTDLFPSNILFRQNAVSGILQNHNMQIDILLYDLASIIKTIYFTNPNNQKDSEEEFFKAYTSFCPLSEEEILSLPVLTAAKLLQKTFFLIEKHLKDTTYKETYLNSAAISLIHAEKALHLFQ